MNTETRNCQNCKIQFSIEPDDFSFYEKMGVPAPGLCPHCRFIRRCMFRNETSLYSRTCELCKKSIISFYNPKSPYVVYCNDCWESDAWDAHTYGMEYNPRRPFFEQLKELFQKVPKKAVFLTNAAGENINSDYTNGAGGGKNG